MRKEIPDGDNQEIELMAKLMDGAVPEVAANKADAMTSRKTGG